MHNKLKIYLDQMFRTEVAKILRAENYDVIRASEVNQNRADDYEILQKAIVENRILITADEHFGDWVVLPLCTHPGVIRVKIHPMTSDNIIKLLLPFLCKHNQEEFRNNLVILSQKQIRWIHTTSIF